MDGLGDDDDGDVQHGDDAADGETEAASGMMNIF
jgi:hypothetical protein